MKLWLVLGLGVIMLGSKALLNIEDNEGKSLSGEIKPVKILKDTQFKDISDDGSKLLLYGLNVYQGYEVKPQVGLGEPNKRNYPTALKVIDYKTENELARLPIKEGLASPMTVFIPDSDLIFYVDFDSRKTRSWNYKNGDSRDCFNWLDNRLQNVTFINNKLAVGGLASKSFDGHKFAKLTFPECQIEVIDKIYPDRKSDGWAYRLNIGGMRIAPDKRSLAYAVRNSTIVFRDTNSFSQIGEISIKPRGFVPIAGFEYTADGKRLVVLEQIPPNKRAGEKEIYFIYVYDVETLKEVRNFPVEGDQAFALSPDNRYVAVGYTTEKKVFLGRSQQATIMLYDLTTGKAVAQFVHKRLRAKDGDYFRSHVANLKFTKDGKFLFSTASGNTYVWDLQNVLN